MMNKFKIYALHPYIRNTEDFVRSLHIDELFSPEDFIWDKMNPDYLFASEWIYSSKDYAAQFRNIARKVPILIFLAGECIYPDLNIFDYATTFSRKLSNIDRIARLPADLFFERCINTTTNTFTEKDAAARLDHLRFCSFIYSNSQAHPNRDKLFTALSSYKKVESLGGHMNNINTLIYVNGGGVRWFELSIRIKSKYKFSIAAENAQQEGYVSEKLLTSFNAHTVPIYWGDPYVAEEYNPEAFVNCNDYDSFDGVVQRVKQIDEDDNLWIHIVTQPWKTQEQQNASKHEHEHYRKFIMNIFSQTTIKAARTGKGFWPENYRKLFYDNQYYFDDLPHKRLIARLHRKIGRIISKIKQQITGISEPRMTDINDFFNDEGEKI